MLLFRPVAGVALGSILVLTGCAGEPAASPAATPTLSPTGASTATATPSPSPTPTAAPTATASPTASPSPPPTAEPTAARADLTFELVPIEFAELRDDGYYWFEGDRPAWVAVQVSNPNEDVWGAVEVSLDIEVLDAPDGEPRASRDGELHISQQSFIVEPASEFPTSSGSPGVATRPHVAIGSARHWLSRGSRDRTTTSSCGPTRCSGTLTTILASH